MDTTAGGGAGGAGGGGGGGSFDPTSSSTLQNDNPAFLTTGFSTIQLIVETYGWILLIVVCGALYLHQKYKPSLEKWKQEREELKEEEESKKNPDKTYEVQVKMEQARQRLQEKASADSAIRRAKEAEIAEQKRLKKIEEWENHKLGKGYHSKSKPKENPETETTTATKPLKRKNDFRPEYNPLGGGGGGGDGGGSSGYRPSRRMNSGG